MSAGAKTGSFDPDTDCFVVPYVDGTAMTSMNKHVFICAKTVWPDYETFLTKLSLAVDL